MSNKTYDRIRRMKTRKMLILALLMAINIAISFFFIEVGPNLRLYFTFIVNMIVAANFSLPLVITYAIVEDFIAFFLFPSGPFFLGYTLTAVAGCVIYYIFLHKEINLKNIIIAKTLVNVFVNIALNSLWSSMLYSKGYIYYLTKSVVKNLAMLPIEIMLFYTIYKLIKPLLNKYMSNMK